MSHPPENFPDFVDKVVEKSFGVSSESLADAKDEYRRIWNGLSGYIAQYKYPDIYQDIKKFRLYTDLSAGDLNIIHSILNPAGATDKGILHVEWVIDFTTYQRPIPLLVELAFLFHTSFDQLELTHVMSFYKSVFFTTASFYCSTFTQRTTFNEVTFKEVVTFDNAKFRRRVDFNRAQFLKHASFKNVNLMDRSSFRRSVFSASVSFKLTEFKANTEFLKTEFCDAEFSHVKFHDTLNFQGVKFNGELNLNSSEFLNRVSFDKAEFISPPLSIRIQAL